MPADSPQIAGRSPVARSRVTNDSALLAGVDGRSAIARRFRDLVGAIISDMGGDDAISEGQRQLARRASALSVLCEHKSLNPARAIGEIKKLMVARR